MNLVSAAMSPSFRSLSAAILCVVGPLIACATASPPIELSCKRPLDPKVANSCVVSEQTLWRGARPGPEAAAALVELGIKTVVSLELLQDDRKAFEAAAINSRDSVEIQYFQIRDWEPLVLLAPNKVDDHVAHFLAITRTQPKPIFVHCRSGQNRTGIMVAAYNVFDGADIEETILEMKKYGGLWSKSDADYIRTLTPQRRAAIEKRVVDWMPRVKRSAKIACASGKCVLNAGSK
jgi:protein-tyrosine phosphatase